MKASHCIQRALERYGLDLTVEDVRDVERTILNGGALLIRREPHGPELYAVRVKGVATRVVFNQEKRSIITFLPIESRKFADVMKAKSAKQMATKGAHT